MIYKILVWMFALFLVGLFAWTMPLSPLGAILAAVFALFMGVVAVIWCENL